MKTKPEAPLLLRKSSITRGLVGLWPMVEHGRTKARDYSGYRNDGTMNSSPGLTVVNGGRALDFSVASSTVSIPHKAWIHPVNAITLCGWYWHKAASTDGNICGKVVSDFSFDIYVNGSNQTIDWDTKIGGSFNALTCFGGPGGLDPFLSSPVFVACTYDGAIKRIYVNGVQRNSVAASGAIFATTDVFHIGSRGDGLQKANYPILQVGMWNRALTASEVMALNANPYLFYKRKTSSLFRTVAASGSTGTLATTNANDTSVASGTTTVTGTLAKTNANDTSTAAGTTTVTGTLAKTNANDTCVASGSVGSPVSGTLAKTNANDTSAATGTTTVLGSLAKTNANDTSAASGTTLILGTLAKTNANDTCVASGSVGSAVFGTLATTNANDTSAASGTTTVTGTLARTNANDTLSALGGTSILGTLSRTNANDTLSSLGGTSVLGTLARTNANDTLSASGFPGSPPAVTPTTANWISPSIRLSVVFFLFWRAY